MMHTTEMRRDRRAMKLAFIGAVSGSDKPAPWIRRYGHEARVLADLALALDAARCVPAPTPAEVQRAAGWLRLALWQRRTAATRPQ